MYHYDLNGILSSPMNIGRAPEERVDTLANEEEKKTIQQLKNAVIGTENYNDILTAMGRPEDIEKPKREISLIKAGVSELSVKEIKKFCDVSFLPITVDKMHCTLLYSIKQPGFFTDNYIYPFKVGVKGLDIFKGQEGEKSVLVILLDSPELEARRVTLMKVPGATKEQEVYNPHITIAKGLDETRFRPLLYQLKIPFSYIELVGETYKEFTEE